MLALVGSTVLTAQNSVFSVNGIGFPNRSTSVRARALGDGFAAFDRASAVNPAAVASFARVNAVATSGSSFRRYTVNGVEVDELTETRFPLAFVGARLGRTRLAFSLGYSSYAERSFDITTADTVVLRGASVPVEDRISSEGGISDLRAALGLSLSSEVRIGAAIHVLSGSSRITARREFLSEDGGISEDYVTSNQRGDLVFSGFGVSVGMIGSPAGSITLAAAARLDTRLDSEFNEAPSGSVELPVTFTAAVTFAPQVAIKWSTAFSWRSWADARTDIAGSGVRAFNTWEVGSGVEFGGPEAGTSRIPLRAGFRYAQLPFSATGNQPREIDVALGSGVSFAGNRAVIDVTLERAFRDGGGASERAWYLMLGITVIP